MLTLEELREYLRARLKREQAKVERPKIRPQQKAPKRSPTPLGPAADSGLLSEGMQPSYAYVPAFDALWAQSWVAAQPEIRRQLRELADELQRIAEMAADEEDVELLLLS